MNELIPLVAVIGALNAAAVIVLAIQVALHLKGHP